MLGVLCAGSGFVVLTWFPEGNGGWLLMTLLMLVRPLLPETARRTLQRKLKEMGLIRRQRNSGDAR